MTGQREQGSPVIRTLLYGVAVALVLAIIAVQSYLNITDVREQERAEQTLRSLRDIRIALEKYYRQTGTYPDLAKEGAANDLKILDFVDNNGHLVSFAEMFGKPQLPETPGNNKIKGSNAVHNVTDFKNASMSGGWNYNYPEKTGEIHANLPHDVYSESIEWEEY